MVMFTFFCFGLRKFGPKNQNCQLEFEFEYAELCSKNMWCSLFLFQTRKTFFVCKSCQKNKNCQPKLKFGTKTNLNMRNSIMIFLFLTININIFPGQIWSKISKLFVQSQFFNTRSNSNKQKSTLLSVLFVLV